VKRPVADKIDAVGYGDARQPRAVPKRAVVDVGHAVGNLVSPGFTGRITNQRGFRLVEQDAVPAAIGGIRLADRDGSQGGAAVEHIVADKRDGVRNGYACQGGAAVERVMVDGADRTRNRYRSQAGTVFKSVLSNPCHAVGQCHRSQRRIVGEGVVADGVERVTAESGRHHQRPAGAGVTGKGRLAAGDGVSVARYVDFGIIAVPRVGKARFAVEVIDLEGGRAKPENIGSQRRGVAEEMRRAQQRAMVKRRIPDGCDARGDGNVGERAAILKCLVPDRGDGIANGNRCQFNAILEGPIAQ